MDAKASNSQLGEPGKPTRRPVGRCGRAGAYRAPSR